MNAMEWIVRDRTTGHGITAYPEPTLQETSLRKGRKLTPEQVRALRQEFAAGVRRREIAERYGINIGQVNKIATGDQYADVR